MTNAEKFPVSIVLENRQDTIHMGDTLLFRSVSPILPLVYNDTYFDENLYIKFSYSFTELPNLNSANDLFDEFSNENTTYNPSNPISARIYRQRLIQSDQYYTLGFTATDTGTYGIQLQVESIDFKETQVPDYKGQCNQTLTKSSGKAYFDMTNLKQQPLAEQLGVWYQYVTCVAAACDTQIVTYTFRVEP